MKRLILFFLIFSLLSTTVLASTDINYIFKDENGYYFSFGTIDTTASDAGVIVDEKKLSLKGGKLYNPSLPRDEWEDATEENNAFNTAISNGGKFGMGFITGRNFKFTPYSTSQDGTDTLSESIIIRTDTGSGLYLPSEFNKQLRNLATVTGEYLEIGTSTEITEIPGPDSDILSGSATAWSGIPSKSGNDYGASTFHKINIKLKADTVKNLKNIMSVNLSLYQAPNRKSSFDNPDGVGICKLYDISDIDFTNITVESLKDLSFTSTKEPLDTNIITSGNDYSYDITSAVKAAIGRMEEGDTTASLTLAVTAVPKSEGGYRIITYTNRGAPYASYLSYIYGEYYDNGEVLKEIAKAYDRQGGQIQYDQKNSRRHLTATPEDATSQRTIYLDCSSYVNSCYREAFGVNVLPYSISEKNPNTNNYNIYAKENPDNADVIGYWEPEDYDTNEEVTNLSESITANLQVGDILNYRHGKTPDNTAGHVYIYIGNGYFMHCQAGGSYTMNEDNPALSYDSSSGEAADGRIFTIANSEIFTNQESKRYIFKITEDDTVQGFCLLRPLERGLTLTDKAKSRMRIAGLSMEKTASVYEHSSVRYGDIITYTVKLENTGSSALSDVSLRDVIPAGTEFVSGDEGVTVSGSKLTWSGNVAGSSTVTVSYDVRVTENTAGKVIKSDATYVSGVKLGTLKHTVSGHSEESTLLIKETAESYVANEKTFDDSLKLPVSLYKDATGLDLFNGYESVQDVLDDIIDETNLTCYTNTELSEILVPDLYGGVDIQSGQASIPDSDRTRLVSEGELAIGDVILAEWSGGNVVYIYTGNSTLISIDENNVAKKLTIGENIFENPDNILVSLIAYDRFAVLRPSMMTAQPTVKVEKIEVTTLPDKLTYINGEAFDPSGMVVKATLSTGEIKEIKEFSISPERFYYPDNNVTVSYGDLTASFNITLSENTTEVNVSDIDNLDVDSYFKVNALVVGVAYDGAEGTEELLIKDLNTDDLISLRNIPYGSIHDYGYTKGDKISVLAVLKESDSEHTPGKKYLEFSDSNGEIATTIVSQGNDLGFKLDNVTVLNTWADMQSFFDVDTIKPYTYVKITEDFYINYYSKGPFYRPNKNSSATGLAGIKPDATRSICLRNDITTKNLGSGWTQLFADNLAVSGYPGTHIENIEFYAIYTGANDYYYQLIIPDRSWIITKSSL